MLCLGFGLFLGCRSGRVSRDRSLRAVPVRAPASFRAMETLVISEQRSHQLHHSSGRRKKASSASPHFSSPQSTRGYHAGNCRAFHSGITIGILPSPPAQGVARTRSSPEPKTPKHQQLHHGKKAQPSNLYDEEVPVHAKSAPSSPTAGSGATFFSGTDATIATENLRRILHLKIEDD